MQLALKRIMDIVAASTLLLVLSPLLVLLAVLVRLRLGSPIFFTQPRIGMGEKPFTLIKFRTMTDARGADGQLLEDAERLHAFGRWLRASSMDELPELWNILMGDMSLVGPRPLLPQYLPHYTAREQLRHRMRPGITGLAQVNGRNTIGWDARLALDAQYVEQFSLLGDLRILWQTVSVVLNRKGIAAEGHATMHALDVERNGKGNL